MEASELTGVAAFMAVSAASSVMGLRWVLIMAMMVIIRWMSCRLCTLLDVRLSQVDVVDDHVSPIGVCIRFFLPKQKGDPLGSNGGAYMPSYPQRFNRYLCPAFVVSLWLLIIRPFLMQAYDAVYARLRAKADSDFTERFCSRRATDAEISALALHELYFFPHMDPAGNFDFTRPMKSDAAAANLASVREEAGFGARAFSWHGMVSGSRIHSSASALPSTSLPIIGVVMQGRHALFYIAASSGVSPLQIQAWARWYATADQNGYMKNDEPFLAITSQQMSGLPNPPGTPVLVLPWKYLGDVSRCIPAYSDHLGRLFRTSEHVVKLATGQQFPSSEDLAAQLTFLVTYLPKLLRTPAADPVVVPALSPEELLAPVAFDAIGTIAAYVRQGRAAPLQVAPAVAAPGFVEAVAAPMPPAAAACINAELSVKNTLLSRQLSGMETLLSTVATCCPTARRAFLAHWGGLGGITDLFSTAVQDINADVMDWSRSRQLPVAASSAAAALSPVMPALPAKEKVPLPPSLSPVDAYKLVGDILGCFTYNSLTIAHVFLST